MKFNKKHVEKMSRIGNYTVIFHDLPSNCYTEQQFAEALDRKYKDFNDILNKNWQEHHGSHQEGGVNKCARGDLSAELTFLEQRRTDGKYIFKLVGYRDDGGRKASRGCWFGCGKLNLTAKDINL